MARPAIDRLLDADAVAELLRAVGASLPDGEVAIEPASAGDHADGGSPGRRRVLRAGGAVVGTLVARGSVPTVTLEHVGAGLELALGEAVAHRALAMEALEAYRELSLLYRVAETIGSTLDASDIGPSILSEAQRVLRSDAAVVLPVGDEGVAGMVTRAEIGNPERVRNLVDAGRRLADAVEESGNPELEVVEGGAFGSILGAPLRTRGQVLGVVLLGRNSGGRPFTAGDQKLVLALAQQAAIAYERASLHRLDRERERLDHEMVLGRRIQLALLPQALPQPAGWQLAAAYEPAREVGGDFYDVFPLRRRRGSLGIVIADVTGKGIPAALLMAYARPLIRAAADQSHGPAETLARVNRVLVRERPTSLFITAFHGQLQLRTGQLTYAVAGHEPPIVVPGDGGRIHRLAAGGPLLGAFDDLGARDRAVRLGPGDLLIAYTDGVTDARRADGVRYGDDRLTRAARRAAGSSAATAARSIVDAAHRFQGSGPAADDLTLLTVRRVPR